MKKLLAVFAFLLVLSFGSVVLIVNTLQDGKVRSADTGQLLATDDEDGDDRGDA